jgi:carboxyl-terminal processing protease
LREENESVLHNVCVTAGSAGRLYSGRPGRPHWVPSNVFDFHHGMKGNRLLLAATFCGLAAVLSNAADLPPEGSLQAVLATVGQILEQAQYSQHKLDPGMGKQILETYLESLDLDKLFFTQEDIDQIRNAYGPGLNDDILLGNLTPAKNIFTIFRRRVDERVAKIGDLLSEHYEFNEDRSIISNRAKERWPAHAAEADDLWRDQIENELLAAKLNTAETEPGPEAIGRHYRELQTQIDGKSDAEVLRIFLEAVAQTYDPHSEYLGPSDWNQFKIDTRLVISGIGAEIRMKDGYAVIDRIFSKGPADRTGKLHIGDKIVAVAEGHGPFVNIVHSNLDQITEKVLGKSGSMVRLQIISSGTKNSTKRQVISLLREEIRLTEEEAQAELIEVDSQGVGQKLGWVTVPTFYGEPGRGTSVTDDVATLVGRLERKGIQGLVIDLRDNGGGSVDEAVRMSGLFISQGPVVQLKDPNKEIHLVTRQRGKVLYEGPMLVLENKLTASASEIFSASMQDYGRAAIVGDSSTFGKGTVQAVIELNRFVDKVDDLSDLAGALKITIEKIYRVTGESTQIKGVISDLKLPSLTEATAPTEDEQEHRLAYDAVPPAAADHLPQGQPLFLDQLRSRSAARIKENPLFQDLSSAIALANESTEKNRVSLNEKIRKDELADRTRLQNQADSDRKTARAQDHNKYYQLTLADVDKPELRLANYNGSEQDTLVHNPPDGLQLFPNPLSRGYGKSDPDELTENEAITRETLNILLDLVDLSRARPMATGSLEIGRCGY